jgi:phage-related protein
MTVPTFNPPIPPSPSVESKREFRVLEAAFGDGYTQVAEDGINNESNDTSLVWNNLTTAEANAIILFFQARKGAESFYYQIPGSTVVRRWRCKSYSTSQSNFNYFSVKAEFTRVFDVDGAYMSFAFTTKDAAVAATSLNIDVPAGTQDGDRMLLFLAIKEDSGAITTPSGWSIKKAKDDYSGQISFALYERVASSEPASYAVNWTNSKIAFAAMVRIRGGGLTGASDSAKGSSNLPSSPSVTTTVTNAAVLRFLAYRDGGPTLLDAPQLHNLMLWLGITAEVAIGVAYKIMDEPGPSDPGVWRINPAAAYGTVTVEVQP